MPYRVFQFPIPAPEQLEELNAFVGIHQIVAVHHHVVQRGQGSVLMFVVEFTGTPSAQERKSQRVDYQEKLSPEDYLVFDRLRDLRKVISEENGVPVYNIFNNAHLAEMAKRRIDSLDAMKSISRVAESRVEKHGERFLAAIREACAGANPENTKE